MADEGCVAVGGGGLWPFHVDPVCDTAGGSGGTEDSGTPAVPDAWVGGSCACGAAPAPGAGVWIALALLWGLRRARGGRTLLGLLVAVGALGIPAPAHAVDVELLHLTLGGPFATIAADPGPPWASTVGIGASFADNPVMEFSGGERVPLMSSLGTLALSGAQNVGGAVRLAAEVPVHGAIGLDPAVPVAPGDAAISLGVAPPLRNRAIHTAWTVGAVLPTGDAEALVGGPGAVTGTLAHQRPIGPWVTAFSAGLRLQSPEVLPGVVMGPRLALALGLARPSGRWVVAGELFGSLPPSWRPPLGEVALEALLTARRTFGAAAVRFGVGAGLGRSIGSPTVRAVLAFDLGSDPTDRDGDGYAGMRDLCPKGPEDRDHHVDFDGCPDPDNDGDGFVDAEDACPDDPETVNGLVDGDGCPDRAARVAFHLASDAPDFEGGTVDVGGQHLELLAGEGVVLTLAPEPVEARGAAPGHHPKVVTLDLTGGGSFDVVLPLAAIGVGAVEVHLVDAGGGQPVLGTVAVGEITALVPDGGLTLPVPSGRVAVSASAPGYGPRVVDVEVPRDATAVVEIALVALDLWQDGQEIEVRDELGFTLGSATLTDDARAPLDALAGWLRDHPEVELLRVEGHADAPGTPRFNLTLSQARARAVADALVARGVAPERLEVLGSGEAKGASLLGERRVTFLVLVWDEGFGGRPAVPEPDLNP